MEPDEQPAQDKPAPDPVTIIFKEPIVRPGSLEAQERGCLCGFESNMRAAFYSAERGKTDTVIVAIHKDCPLHVMVQAPLDDVLGSELLEDD